MKFNNLNPPTQGITHHYSFLLVPSQVEPPNSQEALKQVNCFCCWQNKLGDSLEDTHQILYAKFQPPMGCLHVAHCRQSQCITKIHGCPSSRIFTQLGTAVQL